MSIGYVSPILCRNITLSQENVNSGSAKDNNQQVGSIFYNILCLLCTFIFKIFQQLHLLRWLHGKQQQHAICPRSSDPFYTFHCIKWVTISCTDSITYLVFGLSFVI